MDLRAKQKQTSLLFPILITDLCIRDKVTMDTTRNFEVIPSYFTDISRIEEKYTLEEAGRRGSTPTNTTAEIYINLLFIYETAPTSSSRPISTSAPSSSSQGLYVSTSGEQIWTTQEMILKMGTLDKLVEIRESKMTKSIPVMIERAIPNALTPVKPQSMS